ncbi:MAG: flippase-like domain-containing protein [Clostridiales bacterium]|jgi:uncharacterized protein (TIRG00374 family)|nr:flippase-like domain-containing protein [Clostridiales bacterium]
MDDKLIPLIKGPQKKWSITKASRNVLLTVSFFVAGYALIVSLSSDRAGSISEFFSLLSANYGWFLCALALFFAVVLCETARFAVMLYMTKKGFKPLLVFRTAMIGRFYSAVTPFVNGGQGMQAKILNQAKMGRAVSFTIPFAQAFLKTLVWNFLLLLFFIFNNQQVSVKPWAFVGLIFNGLFPALFFVFSVNEKAAKKILGSALKLGARFKIIKNYDSFLASAWSFLEDLSISVRNIVRNFRGFLLIIILYIAEFTAVMSIPFFLFKSVGEDVTYSFMLISYMYIYLSTTYVPIPGAAGAYELLFYTVYADAVKSDMIYWLMLTMRFFTYFFYIGAGYLVQLFDAISARLKRRRELGKIISEIKTAELNEESIEE